MLRASSQALGHEVAIRGAADATVDPLTPAGRALVAFTDAAVLRDVHEIDGARAELVSAVGPDGAARAASVAGNFELMNRLLDGMGVGPPERAMHLADELGVTPHARS